jgi:phosphomannomutase
MKGMTTVTDLSRIVKAYDVRGRVPQELDERIARALGAALVQTLREAGEPVGKVVIGHDMRASSPGLTAAFLAGATAEGVDAVDVGLATTDMLYYASGAMDLPGAMVTASHNPAQYNGIKLFRSGARPIGQESGLAEIRSRAEAMLDSGAPAAAARGSVEKRDVLAEYAGYLRSLVDLSGIRPLRVVVDAGNGMAGHSVPAVLGDAVLPALPLTIIPLYFELDGSFPNHEANPLEPANLVDLQRTVREQHADVGLFFDGDADRCLVIDEQGTTVSPSALTAIIAVRELARYPGATIIHNLITSSVVPEVIVEHGGRPVRTRVGHSFIKGEMAKTGAVFGGEHSAHYYFRDFWNADTGMLAALHALAALGGQDQPMSKLTAEYEKYPNSGEINSTVTDQQGKLAEVEQKLAGEAGATVDHLDGLSIAFADGSWINLRPSNTEPLLRLNAEARTPERMAQLRDEVLAIVRS